MSIVYIVHLSESEAQSYFGPEWDESDFVVRLPSGHLALRINGEVYFDHDPRPVYGRTLRGHIEGFGTLDEQFIED